MSEAQRCTKMESIGKTFAMIYEGIVRLTLKDVIRRDDPAYCTDAHHCFSLPSSSLPRRDHQPWRLVVFSFRLELSRRGRNVRAFNNTDGCGFSKYRTDLAANTGLTGLVCLEMKRADSTSGKLRVMQNTTDGLGR